MRRVLLVLACAAWAVLQVVAVAWVTLDVSGSGTPAAAARSTGDDGEWLGHAWVDGRKGQSDVDALAVSLRGTGIRDLFVHTGPFHDDGTLTLPTMAGWLVAALHKALPGVRVQAWLGAHPIPGQVRLGDPATRAALLSSTGQVLDAGFDGVHLDFEPVVDGDPNLLTVLSAAHALTRSRGALLSVSASHGAPFPLLARVSRWVPPDWALWSGGYLHQVAIRVDEVAVMAYDTTLPTAAAYTGDVRRDTRQALAEVPPSVTLLIGIPAYHNANLDHHPNAETVPAALHGVRLALGGHPSARPFGVALYVDFTATAVDWADYRAGWVR